MPLPASTPTSSKRVSTTEQRSSADGLALYRKLILVRQAEEAIRRDYFTDEMKTPVHLGIGQEAIAVGVCHVLAARSAARGTSSPARMVPARSAAGAKTFGTYRNHALYLAVTGETDRFFGELYGKATGPGKGKAGSMHIASPEHGLIATSAVVGTTIPLAVGAALANQYRQSSEPVAVFFGDGAVEEGVFWESLNFACLKRLRVLFVCEDNDLAIHTPAVQRRGFTSLVGAVAGFDCHVESGDGGDLSSVVSMTQRMLQRMEQDSRPGILHLSYFRFLEHVGPREDFDAGYRRRPTAEELERLDPAQRFEQELLAQGISARELTAIRQSVDEQIERSVRAAREAPFPAPEELRTDVWVEGGAGGRGQGAGQGQKSHLTFRKALALALEREMEADPSVFVFGLDVPDHKRIYGSTEGLVEKFGVRRCFGTPLSEEAMTGVALGAAISGLRPVHVHIRVDFLLLAMNQIANMISTLRYMSGGRLKIPLVIRAVIGRGWGQSAQHSKSLHSIFAHLPGIKVVMPSSPQDAYSLTRAAIRDENPVILLEHRWLYDVEGEVDESQIGPIGVPAIRRSGKDLTVVATSWMNVEAMKAAEVLAKRGIELEVIDVRTIAPLDDASILESARKTKRCLVADYDWEFCGFSAELAARVSAGCFGELKQPVERLGFAPVPCPTTRPLENLFYPSAVSIIRTAERMLGLGDTDLHGESFYSHEQRFKGPF